LWAGANDISKNNTKGAPKSLTKFMEVHKRVNIILINTPHRHDLLSTSCVNKEVELQRKHFTGHGQHLNYSGKELVSSELAKKIEQHLTKVETIPILIQWKEDNLYEGNLLTQNEIGGTVGSTNHENNVKSNKCQGEIIKGNSRK
jgi:hypothetical protein